MYCRKRSTIKSKASELVQDKWSYLITFNLPLLFLLKKAPALHHLSVVMEKPSGISVCYLKGCFF